VVKPPLALVGPGSAGTLPPRKLGAAGRALWDAVTGEYQIVDAGGVEILAQACLAADRVQELAERISADGPTPAAAPRPIRRCGTSLTGGRSSCGVLRSLD
jgi:hypothetical protein